MPSFCDCGTWLQVPRSASRCILLLASVSDCLICTHILHCRFANFCEYILQSCEYVHVTSACITTHITSSERDGWD